MSEFVKFLAWWRIVCFKLFQIPTSGGKGSISHMFFADDIHILYDPSQVGLRYPRCILTFFEAVSVLRVKLVKSSY